MQEYVTLALFALSAMTMILTLIIIAMVRKVEKRVSRHAAYLKKVYGEVEKAGKGVTELLVAVESVRTSLTSLSDPLINLLDKLSRIVSRGEVSVSETPRPATGPVVPRVPEKIESLDILPAYGVESVVIVSSEGLPVDAYPRDTTRELGGLYVALYRMASQLIENVSWVALSSAEGEIYVVRLEVEGEYYATLTFKSREAVSNIPSLSKALGSYLSRKLSAAS